MIQRTILLACFLVASTQAAIEYDPDFWEGFDKDEEPYEHNWKNIPDFINKTNVEWYFNMTHHGILGATRGIYMNDTLEINIDCFGTKYVTKINEFAAMIKDNWWKNIIQEIAVIY